MIFRFAWKEFRRDFWMNFVVVLQMAVMLLITVAGITSVVSRYQYYAPFADVLEQKGWTVSFMGAPQITTEEMRAQLPDGSHLSGTYSLSGVSTQYKTYVYDDTLWERYFPQLIEGNIVTSNDSPYPQVLVQESMGYHVGDLIPCNQSEYGEQLQVSGVFADHATIVYYNKLVTDTPDFRMLYNTADAPRGTMDNDYCLMSYSESLKLKEIYHNPWGLAYVTVPDGLDDKTMLEAEMLLANNGARPCFTNETLYDNSMAYIYEQIYLLLPVLIGMAVLLIISIFSVNAVTTVRQLRFYAVYRVCGLTWGQCSLIAAAKAVLVSLFSVLCCVGFLWAKAQFGIMRDYLIIIDLPQLLGMAGIVILNLLLSIGITSAIMRRSEPNQLLKAN